MRYIVVLFIVECLVLGSTMTAKLTYENRVPAVVVIQPSDAEFSKTLNESVEPNSLAALKPILPFAVLVRNRATQPLIAVVGAYRLKNPAGVDIFQRFYLHTLDLDPSRILSPGESALIVPITWLCKKIDRTHVMSINRTDFVWPDRAMFESQKSPVVFSIEAVALSDGTTVGPKAAQLVRDLNAFTDAKRDVERGIALRNGAALEAFLNEMIVAGRGLSVVDRPYEAQRASMAQMYLHQLKTGGEEDVRSSANLASKRHVIPTLRSEP